ncbi:MAG TPA: hypothetical protein PLU07_08685 [Ferruginibacter sp.]|nr:hypothetical protein [Ferruginibacter sp.]
MGKAKHFRQLRKLALQLPTISSGNKMPLRHLVSGADAIKNGVKKIHSEKVDPGKKYIAKGEISMSVNHYRKMKKLFTRGGAENVRKYIASLPFS